MTVEITEDQLAKDWTLSHRDIEFVLSNVRSSVHQIRFAIQLCILRKTGRFASDQQSGISLKAVNYLTQQLLIEPVLEIPNLTWSKADYPRFEKIQKYLGYNEFDDEERKNLDLWLIKQAQNHVLDKKELTLRTTEYLRARRVILPPLISLGRFIASAIKNAHADLYKKITERYPKENLPRIDALLASGEDTLYSQLMNFKQSPPIANAKAMNQFFSYFNTLEELKIPECNLSDINPKVLETLAQLAKDHSAWNLHRIKPDEKRYAIVICFLVESVKTILDIIMDMNGLVLGDIERKSKNEFKNQRAVMVRDAKTSRRKTLNFTKEALAIEDPSKITLADYLATFNRQELQDAVEKGLSLTFLPIFLLAIIRINICFYFLKKLSYSVIY